MDILKLIASAKSENASDLHLSVNTPPLVRVNGALQPANGRVPLTESEVTEAFHQLAKPEEIKKFRRELELDFSYALPDGTRLRCSVVRQRGEISLMIRILLPRIPTIEELHLPYIYKRLALMDKGLIVVSGPTGSGKTTSQAAMVQYINTWQTKHILTLEDPIEFSHPNIKSKITQRELGGDTLSFRQALKHTLRQDPDVIVVGEMRDYDTAAAVLSLAETGHLVITTSHAPNATQTLERIIDLFPQEERQLAQMRLASLLSAVLCQTLVPRADGSGRVAAVEILIVNAAVRNIIREGKLVNIANAMRSNHDTGTISLDEALVELYRDGIISLDTASDYCRDIDEVHGMLTVKAPRSAGSIGKKAK